MSTNNLLNDEMDLLVREYMWPNALAKAVFDHFTYALCLKNGLVIHFCDAEFVNREWVRLKDFQDYVNETKTLPFPFGRGVEVRVSDILWVADAPYEV